MSDTAGWLIVVALATIFMERVVEVAVVVGYFVWRLI